MYDPFDDDNYRDDVMIGVGNLAFDDDGNYGYRVDRDFAVDLESGEVRIVFGCDDD